MRKISILLLTLSLCLGAYSGTPAQAKTNEVSKYDASGFMLLSDAVPEAIQDIRYYSSFNFVGKRIDGYEQPCALITKKGGAALKKAAELLRSKGYGIKVFDAYRPVRAVSHFIAWSQDASDIKMKELFYPKLDKKNLFKLGFIAKKSSHSRGSTLDLTLFDLKTRREIDMGAPFDFFSDISYAYTKKGLTKEQIKNRIILREAMVAAGFKPMTTEWWHFTLKNEPYPKTYFDFPVSETSVKRTDTKPIGFVSPQNMSLTPCAYNAPKEQISRLFGEVLSQHLQLRDEVAAFLNDPETKKEGDLDKVWELYDQLTAKIEALKNSPSYTIADVKAFSKDYFNFCVSIDDVTDSTNVPIPVETRLGAISDLLKEIAALIEGHREEDVEESDV